MAARITPAASLNVPLGHGVHALALPTAYVPGAHCCVMMAVALHALPDGHDCGAASPGTAHRKPSGQACGALAPAGQIWPTPQSPDEVLSPVELQKRPLGHGSGLVKPATGHTDPVGHGSAAPFTQYDPGEHCTAALTPPPLQKHPAGHDALNALLPAGQNVPSGHATLTSGFSQ